MCMVWLYHSDLTIKKFIHVMFVYIDVFTKKKIRILLAGTSLEISCVSLVQKWLELNRIHLLEQ